MTIHELLTGSHLATADAEVLLASLLHKDRTWLYAHADDEVTHEQESAWETWRQRRENGEPVAYITGTKEFFGHVFHVTPAVLIPRPATELLVERALDVLNNNVPVQHIQEIDTDIVAWTDVWGREATTVVDIGTGSGCIAISIALARPDLRVMATDIDDGALQVATENAQRLGARVEYRNGNALDSILDLTEPFLIVSNPPYIPSETKLEKDVSDFEPHHALFSGADGADVIRRIITQAKNHPHCIGFVMECQKEQPRLA